MSAQFPIREPADLNDDALRARAVAAARGDAAFDVLITGGTLVDVVTGELRAADIGIVGPLIASVHEPVSRSDAAQVVDASGAFVSPGSDRHAYAHRKLDDNACCLCGGSGCPRRYDYRLGPA